MNYKTTRNIASASLGLGATPACASPAIHLSDDKNANVVNRIPAFLAPLAFLAQRAFTHSAAVSQPDTTSPFRPPPARTPPTTSAKHP